MSAKVKILNCLCVFCTKLLRRSTDWRVYKWHIRGRFRNARGFFRFAYCIFTLFTKQIQHINTKMEWVVVVLSVCVAVSAMWTFMAVWESNVAAVLLQVSGVMLAFVLSIRLVRFLSYDGNLRIRDSTKCHNWRSTGALQKPLVCSSCEVLMAVGEGLYCDCCGVSAHGSCVKTANSKLRCKAIHTSDKGPLKHHWIRGNLSETAICEVCEEDAGSGPGLHDFECCWCHRTVHTACLIDIGEACDLGPFRRLIVPANCLEVELRRSRIRRRLYLSSVNPTEIDGWNPLIVIANRLSGSSDAENVLSAFRRFLNPAQVVDLAECSPDVALKWCGLLRSAGASPIVVVAGGDGTIGWVLTEMYNMKLEPPAPVGMIPLGTGNDLSRVLGWGSEACSQVDAESILRQVQEANQVDMDRWEVELKPIRHLGVGRPERHLFMYNYLSIGVDAQVTLNFHVARKSELYVRKSRFINKLLYLIYGAKQVLERSCCNLERRLELYLDGEKVDLPEVESIVILNIPSWGAGVRLWDMLNDESKGPQSFNDGKLEVLALYSSWHMGQLRLGWSKPHCVGQAESIEIRLTDEVPVQADGEPWVQTPGTIKILLNGKVKMLSPPEDTN